MKYVAIVDYNPNCPVHDSGRQDQPRFFNSFKDILREANSDMGDYYYKTVYSTRTGFPIFSFEYDYGRHSVTGITAEIGFLKLRTVDDGSGKRIWSRQ